MSRYMGVYRMDGEHPHLSPGSPQALAIKDINKLFHICSLDFKLHSFYETRPTKLAGEMDFIVRGQSAISRRPNERFTYLDADHHNMCVYKSRNSPDYRLVRGALADLVATARANAGNAS
jgi:hypothetical protein